MLVGHSEPLSIVFCFSSGKARCTKISGEGKFNVQDPALLPLLAALSLLSSFYYATW